MFCSKFNLCFDILSVLLNSSILVRTKTKELAQLINKKILNDGLVYSNSVWVFFLQNQTEFFYLIFLINFDHTLQGVFEEFSLKAYKLRKGLKNLLKNF